jgi:hypothetical protein
LAVGTQLSNGENRPVGQHSHGVSDPGHTHVMTLDADSGPDGGSGAGASEDTYNVSSVSTQSAKTGISVQDSGGVAGTNAPYLQLLICQKS